MSNILTDDSVSFFVYGTPQAQGSKRGFVVNGRAVIADASPKLKPWRAAVAAQADIGRTFDGPLEVELTFHLPKPQKPRWVWPAVKPDIDKLARGALDGLTEGGLIADDARVVSLHVTKVYAPQLGMKVKVTAL